MKYHPFRKKTRINTKLFLIFLSTIFIPLIVFALFLYNHQIRLMESESKKSAERELVQMADRISLEFTQIVSVSNLFYLDRDLGSFLKDYNSTFSEDFEEPYDINSILNKYSAGVNNTNFQCVVVALNGKVFGTPMFLKKMPYLDIESRQWYPSIKNYQTSVIWINDSYLDKLFTSPDYPYVYIIRQLHDLETWDRIGTLIIGISENQIRKKYSGYVGSTQSTYILDNKDHIISYIDNLDLSNSPLGLADRFRNYSGSFVYGSGEYKKLVTFHTINSTQWKIVTFSDINALFTTFSGALNVFLMIMLFYLITTTILFFALGKRFLNPINNLYNKMAKVKTGDLNVRVTVNSNDEISELSEQFNDMISKIQELMSQVVTEQELKREAEIISLQSQINPHFLYNTLASIRFMVYSGNKEDADIIILALIRLMKNSLSDSKKFITVDKEISLLQDYINIQKLAFTKPLTVKLSIEDDIKDCKIIKLLLQPLVENAIMHGLKPKKDDCVLSITGRSIDSALEFIIEDNGIGFDSSKCDLSSKTPDFTRGVGMQNVHGRIILNFGEQYGLNICSHINKGTTVTLRIPKIISKGDYLSYEHFDS
ncbi:MAG: hypothetical protein APF77_01665 [Clostridia bacterium BRH_c25]|nr:MAG: hypothetical protein APF77_01665 [Clostridia bacterium BRH_c25]